jgi:hypothetical protein
MVRTAALLLATATLALADTQTPQSYSGDYVIKVSYHYLLSQPEGYAADAKKKWPLVIFLHGSGERGTDLEQIKRHGPPKLIAAGQKFPAVVASLNGATSSEDVIRKSLEWVLSLDSATVEAARIKFENDKKAADDKRKARQEEAVKKKAAKAALASKEAQNAEAELLGKPLPFPEVREQLKKVAAEEAPTEG